MNAYKFTGPDGTTYNGFRWALPTADGPGEWVEVGESRTTLTAGALCSGQVLHATDAAHLLDWLDAELYEVEIDENRGVVIGPDKIGFRRGRLLRRVEEWDERSVRLFACDCAEDALQYAEPDARETLECAIYIARCHADGEATLQDLAAAGAAAGAAARAAAGAAAWAAAWAAAGAAAWAAAGAAARAAAGAAAGAAARAKYEAWLVERLGLA